MTQNTTKGGQAPPLTKFSNNYPESRGLLSKRQNAPQTEQAADQVSQSFKRPDPESEP